MNETLRLFPPVPLNIRRTIAHALLPSTSSEQRIYIPANTSLVISTIQMQRDTEVWGEDAAEFRPERWETNDGHEEAMRGREGFAAWNLGPRMVCPPPRSGLMR